MRFSVLSSQSNTWDVFRVGVVGLTSQGRRAPAVEVRVSIEGKAYRGKLVGPSATARLHFLLRCLRRKRGKDGGGVEALEVRPFVVPVGSPTIGCIDSGRFCFTNGR